ncbi:uncharacterized protein METZ01_LOCUS142331, partial [marine metagenome]
RLSIYYQEKQFYSPGGINQWGKKTPSIIKVK